VLKAEPLPVIVAPIIAAPADARTRPGVLQQSTAEADSRGSGTSGGVGAGRGTGVGPGDGSGIGPGSGGGTGGGPYRPGSGIEAPQLLREVKADYTEDARRRGVSGDVVLEIVVRRDGSVGDVKVLQGLPGGLNDRAVNAVRQWRFTPAHRQGAAVDVIVEVAVEFKLR
jgi:TonB family protein